jgi:hypothetical protein
MNKTQNASMLALPLVATGLNRFRISQDRLLQQLCAATNSTSQAREDRDFDAFLYIIIVLVFYAISMVLLMVKYIRREERDAALDFYYVEFVKREKFHSLNRHKFYTGLFKKIWKKKGPLPISQVYNETKQYACTTDPKCISKEIASCARNSLQSIGGRRPLLPRNLEAISETPDLEGNVQSRSPSCFDDRPDVETTTVDFHYAALSDTYTFTDDETDTDSDEATSAPCRKALRASMYETSV